MRFSPPASTCQRLSILTTPRPLSAAVVYLSRDLVTLVESFASSMKQRIEKALHLVLDNDPPASSQLYAVIMALNVCKKVRVYGVDPGCTMKNHRCMYTYFDESEPSKRAMQQLVRLAREGRGGFSRLSICLRLPSPYMLFWSTDPREQHHPGAARGGAQPASCSHASANLPPSLSFPASSPQHNALASFLGHLPFPTDAPSTQPEPPNAIPPLHTEALMCPLLSRLLQSASVFSWRLRVKGGGSESPP